MNIYGITKSYTKHNNKKSIQWKGNYDGENANIDLQLIENGRKQNMKLKLDNHEIMELLNIQPIEKSLEERLINDFIPMSKNTLSIIPKKTRKRKYKKLKSKPKKYSKKK
jgi:hypothetical protein